MNPFESGTLGLAVSVFLSLTAIVAGILAWQKQDARYAETARRSLIANCFVLTICSGILVTAFLLDRFDIQYVAYNSQRSMPTFYKFSAFWGSLDGSMLLWAWLVAVFGAAAAIRHRRSDPELLPLVAAALSSVLLFFVTVILATTNPFVPLVDAAGVPFTPRDGLGLNPLLQNPAMVLHPPTLYLGFTGFTIPFAFAIAALVTGRLDDEWMRSVRRWTIIAWAFLTVGNVLGSNWAYMELGWGGYWGWDPVENSSLMPWFTGTAFLHSVMLQEKRNMFRIWNVLLIMMTYWLTIFGTFLTRSGVVSSVHAFANGTVGPLFLGYLAVVVTIGLALLYWRWPLLATSPKLKSPISREGAFVFNNFILMGLLFATFWGTVFPVLNELFTGQKITVGAPFFNRINAPLAIALLVLLSFGPVIAWGQASWQNFRRSMMQPFVLGLVTGAALLVAGIREPYAIFIYVFVVTAAAAMGIEVWRGVASRHRRLNEGWLLALQRLVGRNRRRYGGYIVHLGVLLAFIGISGSFFDEETQLSLKPGESAEFAGYQLQLKSIEAYHQPNYESQAAIFDVTRSDGKSLLMWPEKRQYLDQRGETATEVAIWSTLFHDLYLIFLSEDEVTGAGIFRFHLNPLVMWVWIGCIVMVLGVTVSIGKKRETIEAG